jgi:hypothetical protein
MIADTIEIYMGFSPTFRILRVFWSYPKSCSSAFLILVFIGYVSEKIGVVV